MSQEAEQTLLFSIIADEIRSAWIDYNRNISNIQINHKNVAESSRGNVYIATVIRKEKALSAYFIDYLDDDGIVTQGFLPWKETHLGIKKGSLFVSDYKAEDGVNSPNSSLEIGQKILVQIVRDKRDNKGAALTTFISLPGSFLVLLPNNPETAGISRKVEINSKDQAKELIKNLNFPENMGIIMRTAGLKLDQNILQKDLDGLLEKWNLIQAKVAQSQELSIVHKESVGLEKLIRDSLGVNVSKIVIDDAAYFSIISKYIQALRPDFKGEIEYYTSKVPLFTHFQVQQQLETMFAREVALPSGGSIVIDRTEALVAIDINSGKSIKNSSIEATALNTNLEAAKVIAVQLQLRDIGGLIVIDFIDMSNKADREKVEATFKTALAASNARTHVYEISKLGLLEMSRQRMKPSVGESNLLECESCHKRGYVRSPKSFSASIIHVLEENAVHSENYILQIQIPTKVANYLWNNKASHILHLEKKYNIEIIIIANDSYNIPKYQLKRIKAVSSSEAICNSTSFIDKDLSEVYTKKYKHPTSQNKVKNPVKECGLFSAIWSKLFANSTETKPVVADKTYKSNSRRRRKTSNYDNKNSRQDRQSSNSNKNNRQDKTNFNANKNNRQDKQDNEDFNSNRNRSNNRRRRNHHNRDKSSNSNVGVTANNQTSSEQDYL